jgi:hypothetical protein
MCRAMRGTMLRNLIGVFAILTLALLSLAAGPAAAQNISMSPFKQQERKLTPEEIEKQKAADAAYKAAMQKIPDKKVANDPWGGIRDTTPQASPSTATPPTKTAKTKQPPQ